MTAAPELLGTCWTTAGDVTPARTGPSPFPVEERVEALARDGWQGIGLVHDDLRVVRETIGFTALRRLVDAAGLRHVEVELLEDWWETGPPGAAAAERRELLLEAAVALGARHVKAGCPTGGHPASWRDLVVPLRELTEAAAAVGVPVALEPLPFSTVATVPLGARLVAEVGADGLGLLVDAWHVFRAGTTLEELAAALAPGSVLGVELDDADPVVVGTLFEDTVERRRYPGEGCFDLEGLVRVLVATGFEGPWGVEILSAEHRVRPLDEGLRAARETATAVLARALPERGWAPGSRHRGGSGASGPVPGRAERAPGCS